MASLTGRHWRAHGLVDVNVFVALGFLFMQRSVTMTGVRLASIIAGSVVVAGGGLALWFVVT